jgi:hypothetical protein
MLGAELAGCTKRAIALTLRRSRMHDAGVVELAEVH